MYSGDRKIATKGPTVPVGNEACVLHWVVEPSLEIFPFLWKTFFSHTIHFTMNCIIFVANVTELKLTKQPFGGQKNNIKWPVKSN